MKTRDSVAMGKLLAGALDTIERGGPGSGHAGHAGRPPEVGGSKPGGVLIGRADAPDSDEQFKFSGEASLERPKGSGVGISLRSEKGRGRLEVHGAKDGKGRTQKHTAVVQVGDSEVSLDHDELHALRSHMHFVQMANSKGITTISEKKIARGNSVDVKVGGKSVRIPVNDASVQAIDDAVWDTKVKGYHLAAERRSEVVSAAEKMREENPARVTKSLGFSKAGTYAAFKTHAERFTDKGLRGMATKRAAGKGGGASAYFQKAARLALGARTEARVAETEMSATQAARAYRTAATWTTILSRRK